MTLRLVSAGEAEALAALHASAFTQPWSRQEIAELLERHEVFALAAEGGFILMRAAGGECEVLTRAVAPLARRRGLGRRLLQAALAEAAARGAESAFLEVAADNAAAIGLYRAEGFEPVGRRKAYYVRTGGAEDALVLSRALPCADA
jgi:ribosomal-protein-alanine N-acetyltransferase